MKTYYNLSLTTVNSHISGFRVYYILPTKNLKESNAVSTLHYNAYSNGASDHFIKYEPSTLDLLRIGLK